jgi:hypothetical protein
METEELGCSSFGTDLVEDAAQSPCDRVEVGRRQFIKRAENKVPRVWIRFLFVRPDEQMEQIALVLILAVESASSYTRS